MELTIISNKNLNIRISDLFEGTTKLIKSAKKTGLICKIGVNKTTNKAKNTKINLKIVIHCALHSL